MTDTFQFAVVQANANGDDQPYLPEGLPEHRVLGTCELNEALLHKGFPTMRHRSPSGLALALSFSRARFTGKLKVQRKQFHKSGKALGMKLRSPRRGAAVVKTHVAPEGVVLRKRLLKKSGAKVAFIETHFVQDAYQIHKPNDPENRRLWDTSWRKLNRLVRRLHRLGYLVVLLGDFNRIHCPAPAGMVEVAHDVFDHIFITKSPNLRAATRSISGPASGHKGGYHHKSLGVVLELDLKNGAS